MWMWRVEAGGEYLSVLEREVWTGVGCVSEMVSRF